MKVVRKAYEKPKVRIVTGHVSFVGSPQADNKLAKVGRRLPTELTTRVHNPVRRVGSPDSCDPRRAGTHADEVLVEGRRFPKPETAGSNPVTRSMSACFAA